MTNFCMLPYSPDYIIPFGLGARGWVIVSSPPSRYTFCAPRVFTLHAQLGSVLTHTTFQWYCGVVYRLHPIITRLPMPETSLPVIRPWRRTGKQFPCMICGKLFYRRGSQIARGITKTCGAPECKSASMQGENNPFWGKDHTPEVRAHIASIKRANPTKRKPGPPKGYKHTPEARAKMSASLRERWRLNRDKMLAQFQHPQKPRDKQRYRYCFTRWQRENWTASNCLWCDTTNDLVLDHIIPVMCGGLNEQKNAQTLCQPCNMWKLKYVDRPLLLAGLGNQGG